MKKKWLITLMALVIFMSMSEKLLAPPYSVICIDPGHGGIGADKFHNGGDGYGNAGPMLGIAEQWVNWQVACKVRDLIIYQTMFPVIMTREVEADTNLPPTHTENLWYRANKANYGDVGGLVTQFISVHHNGYTPYPGTQGTEVWWSSQLETDSSYDRVRGYWRPAYEDSLLAMKSHLRLLEWWKYNDRCLTRCEPGSGSSFCCDETRLPSGERKFVLFNTVMPSGLSEASNLRDTTEELLFDDPNSGHADSEAVALYDGWYSHANNTGIAIVRNSYTLGNGGEVVIDEWPCYDGDTASSPYVRCWIMGEQYCLIAITPQTIQGYEYTFHHWTHLNSVGLPIGDDWYDPVWFITVPAELNYHNYVAYFTGGPYSAQVVSPNGGQIWHVGEQRDIVWNASMGADSTTYVDVRLDRNGGNDGYPELIVDSVPRAWYYGWNWTVTGPISSHCRIKVVAYDRAGNSAWDISNQDFSISASGNNNPAIDSRLHCKYPYDECNECIKYGESFTLEVNAHDPDADSMYYEWHCGPPPFGGHFSNGQNVMTTAQNYVVYTAPTQKGRENYDFLSVAVTDVRGGQSWTSGELGIWEPGTSCLCGDANGNSSADLSDAGYIITYLFQGGPPPPEPIERADPNNDCVVANLADAAYIANWLFLGGPPPVCCWIRPPEEFAEFF